MVKSYRLFLNYGGNSFGFLWFLLMPGSNQCVRGYLIFTFLANLQILVCFKRFVARCWVLQVLEAFDVRFFGQNAFFCLLSLMGHWFYLFWYCATVYAKVVHFKSTDFHSMPFFLNVVLSIVCSCLPWHIVDLRLVYPLWRGFISLRLSQ